MANPGYAAAAREVAMYQRFPNLDAMIAEAEYESTHVCLDCDEIQSVQPFDICRECGGRLIEREP